MEAKAEAAEVEAKAEAAGRAEAEAGARAADLDHEELRATAHARQEVYTHLARAELWPHRARVRVGLQAEAVALAALDAAAAHDAVVAHAEQQLAALDVGEGVDVLCDVDAPPGG